MITFLRIDGRLIHGQVVEAWLPGLKVARVVVADDEAAHSPLMKTAMGLAVPPELEVDILPLRRDCRSPPSPPTASAPCSCSATSRRSSRREGSGFRAPG